MVRDVEHLVKNNKGQTLVEYVLIVSLVAVIVIAIVKIFGGYLNDAMTRTGCELTNKEFVEGTTPGTGECKDKE